MLICGLNWTKIIIILTAIVRVMILNMQESIELKKRDRCDYEEMIESWLAAGFLTAAEASSLRHLLDEHYPVSEV